ncbi:MAG: SRPBCC family protein [Jiangellaceae bacterium]
MTPTVRTQTPDDATVVATVTLSADRERLFRAFTDPAELARWWWPERFATTYALDVRDGGAFRIRSDAADMGISGNYVEVARPERLRMTWAWDGEQGVTNVAVEFREVDDGRTEVIVTHSANASAEDRDNHAQGWRDCLSRLVELQAK